MIKDYSIEDRWIEVKEPIVEYYGSDALNKLTYAIIGACFDVHNELGQGFLEAVYKDALEIELKKRNINFERERKYKISYKGVTLPHFYYADFVIENQVILELKAQEGDMEEHYKQVINYLAVSTCEIGLLINFGTSSLKYKRILLTKKSV
jgi:GxxExxY protein